METKQKTKIGKVKQIAQNQGQAEKYFGVSRAVQRAAKQAGCSAFVGDRVHRKPLLEWVRRNKVLAAEAEATAEAKGSEAQLKRERLTLQIQHARLNYERDKKELIPLQEHLGTLALISAVTQEEARALMERDHYRVWMQRTQSKLETVLRASAEIKAFGPGDYRWDGESWFAIPTKQK